MPKTNILITGPPRCGKSTFMERVVRSIDKPTTGFFTREIREEGRRVGFSINTLDGREGILAYRDMESQWNVGRYGVNLNDIDAIAVPSMIPSREEEIIVIDEIGKMECFSNRFKEALLRVLDLPNWTIASIAHNADLFIQEIKEREDVMLIEITRQDQGIQLNRILKYIDAI